jgi:5'-nucleotidase
MRQPAVVKNILIAQAAVGADQIGRFDIVVDDDNNSIVEWKWLLVSICSNTIQPDEESQKFIDSYSSEIDRKYNMLLCQTAQELTHPSRIIETSLGNLFAENAACDVALIGSSSIRQKQITPVVTLPDLWQTFPYDDVLSTLPSLASKYSASSATLCTLRTVTVKMNAIMSIAVCALFL